MIFKCFFIIIILINVFFFKKTDSPELLQLLDDFKEMIEELKERIEPTITKVRTGDLPTKGGLLKQKEKRKHFKFFFEKNRNFFIGC